MSVTVGARSTRDEPSHADRLTVAIQRNGLDLLRYFQRRSSEPADAADLYGELLLLAVRKEAGLPLDDTACRMFLFGMAKNVLRNARRSAFRSHLAVEHLSDLLALNTPTADSTSDSDTRHDVAAAINQLPRRHSEIVRLIHWDGFSQAEVATILGLPPATVRSRYSRARKTLASRLSLEER